MSFLIKCALLLFAGLSYGQHQLRFVDEKLYHEPAILDDSEILAVSNLSNDVSFKTILSNVLVPRIVGTETHEKVKDYIVNFLENLGWEVEEDSFIQQVPIGKLNFTNIIARLNPNAKRFLTIACHYDSKYIKNEVFLGATDSAVPCTMMLDMAQSPNDLLEPFRNSDVSLMYLFFDGEEAFKQWSPTDSIYGAKHLSKLWQKTPFNEFKGGNQVDRMDMIVLLDLLGAPTPKFYNYYQLKTSRFYTLLADIEDKLFSMGQLSNYSPQQRYFLRTKRVSHIEDDHLAFIYNIVRPVPILHVIPDPFPPNWHLVGDNYNALDFPTIDNLNKIFRIFVMSYLQGSFSQRRFNGIQKRFADYLNYDNSYYGINRTYSEGPSDRD